MSQDYKEQLESYSDLSNLEPIDLIESYINHDNKELFYNRLYNVVLNITVSSDFKNLNEKAEIIGIPKLVQAIFGELPAILIEYTSSTNEKLEEYTFKNILEDLREDLSKYFNINLNPIFQDYYHNLHILIPPEPSYFDAIVKSFYENYEKELNKISNNAIA